MEIDYVSSDGDTALKEVEACRTKRGPKSKSLQHWHAPVAQHNLWLFRCHYCTAWVNHSRLLLTSYRQTNISFCAQRTKLAPHSKCVWEWKPTSAYKQSHCTYKTLSPWQSKACRGWRWCLADGNTHQSPNWDIGKSGSYGFLSCQRSFESCGHYHPPGLS